MKKYISKLHYLTEDSAHRSQVTQTQMACEAGAGWIQYRCLNKSEEEMLEELRLIASICDDWGTTLMVTNHFHLVNQADIQGVHIEDMDADLLQIRAEIGKDKTLGASANTLEQIVDHIKNGADYIGCGPFGHTNTKPNSFPHWGMEGYWKMVDQLQKKNLEIPVIAVGGIELKDVEELMRTGIHGIAVSAAINKADNFATAYKEFHQSLF